MATSYCNNPISAWMLQDFVDGHNIIILKQWILLYLKVSQHLVPEGEKFRMKQRLKALFCK